MTRADRAEPPPTHPTNGAESNTAEKLQARANWVLAGIRLPG